MQWLEGGFQEIQKIDIIHAKLGALREISLQRG